VFVNRPTVRNGQVCVCRGKCLCDESTVQSHQCTMQYYWYSSYCTVLLVCLIQYYTYTRGCDTYKPIRVPILLVHYCQAFSTVLYSNLIGLSRRLRRIRLLHSTVQYSTVELLLPVLTAPRQPRQQHQPAAERCALLFFLLIVVALNRRPRTSTFLLFSGSIRRWCP